MMCEKAGEVTAQTRSKSLQLGAIFRAYSKVRTYVRTYLRYLSKQLYNPQQVLFLHTFHVYQLHVGEDWYILDQVHLGDIAFPLAMQSWV